MQTKGVLLNKKISDYKMLAIDMDGTTLNSNHELSKRTISAIQIVYKMGLNVLFATGRMSSAVTKHINILGINGLIVSHNGALVLDVYSNHIYLHDTVKKTIVKEVVDFYKSTESILHFNDLDRVLVEKLSDKSIKYAIELGIELELITSFYNIFNEPTSLLLIHKKNTLNKFLDYMKQHFNQLFDYVFIPWDEDNWMLQFLAPNTSKGAAVIDLAKKLNISQNEIISFGDSFNDMEMIRQCGFGVAMGNSCEELKYIADYVTKNNNQDGVAYVLEILINNNI